MSNLTTEHDPLLQQLNQLVAARFRLVESRLTPEEPLIGGRLGLDSLDALELGMSVEEKFGVTIASAAESRTAFASLASLAAFIRRQAPPLPIGSPARL